MKLCFLTVMPSPYMEDFFASMARDPEIQLQVLYQEMTAPDTHWGEQKLPSYAKVMRGRWYPFLGGRLHHNPDVRKELSAAAADLYIVQGYAGFTSQRAFRWLRKHQKTWIFWGERPGMKSGGMLRNYLRNRALRPVVESADAIAAIGCLAVRAYEERLTREIPVVNIPYLCNLESFQVAADANPNRPPAPIGARPAITILYCGQLIERKGLFTLLDAFRRLRSDELDLKLKLVGTGPLKQSLEASLPPEFAPAVEFAGFQPVDSLPSHFAAADLFVLPSHHDGWGVVVNQALAAGLPLVCSEAVGAAHDLIRDGWNGYRFPPGDAVSLAARLQELIDDADRRKEMSHNSREFSNSWKTETGVGLWKQLAEQLAVVNHEVIAPSSSLLSS